MNDAEFLQNTINSQWDFLKNSIMTSNNLEELLNFCQKLRPYSVRNVLLAIYQTNGMVREIHGSDEWYNKFGATTKLGAKPILIFAPDDNPNATKKRFCVTNVYDISQTDLNQRNDNPPICPTMIMRFLNEMCKRENILLRIGQFQTNCNRDAAVKFGTNEIMLSKNSTFKFFYLLKNYFLISINNQILNGKIAPIPIRTATAISIASAVEVMCWLKEKPPMIPAVAKQELLEISFENNIKIINKFSNDVIRKLEKLIKESLKNEERKERAY